MKAYQDFKNTDIAIQKREYEEYLRAYFAGQAMRGLFSSGTYSTNSNEEKDVTDAAVNAADLLIEKLKQPKK